MTSLLPNIWAVRVPKDAINVSIAKQGDLYWIFYDIPNPGHPPEDYRHPIKKTTGTMSLIGVGISEEVAGKIVERIDYLYNDPCPGFRDYNPEFYPKLFLYPTDSLISLLKSKGLNTEDNYVFLQLND